VRDAVDGAIAAAEADGGFAALKLARLLVRHEAASLGRSGKAYAAFALTSPCRRSSSSSVTCPPTIIENVDEQIADRAARDLGYAGTNGRTEKPDRSTKLVDWLCNEVSAAEIQSESPLAWESLQPHLQPGDALWYLRFGSRVFRGACDDRSNTEDIDVP
jgi:hypothetical protein